jgi:hypothetical protein
MEFLFFCCCRNSVSGKVTSSYYNIVTTGGRGGGLCIIRCAFGLALGFICSWIATTTDYNHCEQLSTGSFLNRSCKLVVNRSTAPSDLCFAGFHSTAIRLLLLYRSNRLTLEACFSPTQKGLPLLTVRSVCYRGYVFSPTCYRRNNVSAASSVSVTADTIVSLLPPRRVYVLLPRACHNVPPTALNETQRALEKCFCCMNRAVSQCG